MAVFVYVLDHDNGGAPDPSEGMCTLAYCMWMTRSVARKDDLVVGLGGRRHREAKGGWCIIYAMRVAENLNFDEYHARFSGRQSGERLSAEDKAAVRAKADAALVSTDFVYFGSGAPILEDEGLRFLREAFITDKGKLYCLGHRRITDKDDIHTVSTWFKEQKKGCRGKPFDNWKQDTATPLCVPPRRRRKC